MLYQDDILGDGSQIRKTIHPDPKVPSLLSGKKRLGIFKDLEGYQDKSLGFWTEWDQRAARFVRPDFIFSGLHPLHNYPSRYLCSGQGLMYFGFYGEVRFRRDSFCV